MSLRTSYNRAVKKSISLPILLLEKGVCRAREVGFTTFSDYVQMLIRKDTMPKLSENVTLGGAES